jgi:cytochrome c-type biogenesis protein CcmH/NrfG
MRIGVVAMATALACAPVGASAQSEMEQVQQAGDRLLNANREDLQQNAQLATRALKAGDFRAARKYAQTVTRGDPKRVEAWLLLGAAQIGLQDWRAARGTYTTAVRVGPGNAEAHAGLGVAYARTSDPKARTQLAWLAQAASACGSCWQAADLAKFHRNVEAAIAIAAAPAGAGPPGQ